MNKNLMSAPVLTVSPAVFTVLFPSIHKVLPKLHES